MKFVILLLAFFISLLTSTSALKCYRCRDGGGKPLSLPELERAGEEKPPDCENTGNSSISSMPNGREESCSAEIKDPYCYKLVKDGKVRTRACTSLAETLWVATGVKAGECRNSTYHPGVADKTFDACLCNSDLCNGHTKIVGMSLTTLLGGVILALLLIK